jgi:hypothetical protein
MTIECLVRLGFPICPKRLFHLAYQTWKLSSVNAMLVKGRRSTTIFQSSPLTLDID